VSGQESPQSPVGTRLAELMAERDLRSEDVASRLYISERTVRRWLGGQNEPTRSLARGLGDLFEVDWREFRTPEAA
jgi:transcriptional regulator with XRE-family HTH domain